MGAKIDYDGFNLEIRDGLWISAICQLEPFEPAEYYASQEEFFITSPWGQKHYRSPKGRWYETLDGLSTNYTDIKLHCVRAYRK